MAIKKDPSKKPSKSAATPKKKVVKKVSPAKSKPEIIKEKPIIVEKAETVAPKVEESKVETTETATETKSPSKKSWWGVLAVFLLLVLTGILLFKFNADFRSNVNKMANSIGLGKLIGKENDINSPKEKFPLKLTIVYNKNDATQKETIDRYLVNIENNLENTKVEPTWYDKNDPQGIDLLTKLEAKYLPMFVTDESIQKHPQYAMFAPAIKTVNGVMAFQSQGMEYLQTPAVGDAKYLGGDPKTAKLVIIEYSSPSCGYCKMMDPILKKVVDKFGKQVSVVIKHYDRGGIDSTLSQAIECAGEQNRYERMMSSLFDKQADIFSAAESTDPEALNNKIKEISRNVGANGDKVLACVKSGKYAELVKNQTKEGQDYGVIGTPSLFVGKKFIGGAMEESSFISLVESELK